MPQKTKNEQVIDFNEARNQKLEEKRRKTERVFFKQLLGMYTVVDGEQMRAIDIVDISDEGLSFQVPFNPEKPWPKNLEHFQIRMYMNQDMYLPISLQIQNSRPCIENGVRYIRYGCKVDQSLQSYQAYRSFVQFLKSYAEHAHQDKGDVTLFYL